MFILSKAFWVGAADRAIRTFAQASVAILTAGSVGVLEADLLGAASAGLMAALVSILTSVSTPAQIAVGSKDSEADLDTLELDSDSTYEQLGT